MTGLNRHEMWERAGERCRIQEEGSLHRFGWIFREIQELGGKDWQCRSSSGRRFDPEPRTDQNQDRRKTAYFHVHHARNASVCQDPDALWNSATLSLGECCRIGDGRSLSPFRTIFAKQEGGARQEEGDSKPQWSVAQCWSEARRCAQAASQAASATSPLTDPPCLGCTACLRSSRPSHSCRLRTAHAWNNWHCAAASPTRRACRQPL